MSVHAFCLSSRRAMVRSHAEGRVECRTDPDWFTPYQRREIIDWTPAYPVNVGVECLPQWMEKTGAKRIIGKGGMMSTEYKDYFVPNGAVYLSIVGGGTGGFLARGVTDIEAVLWAEELGIAQAIWVLSCAKMGPFRVACDRSGTSLFESKIPESSKGCAVL